MVNAGGGILTRVGSWGPLDSPPDQQPGGSKNVNLLLVPKDRVEKRRPRAPNMLLMVPALVQPSPRKEICDHTANELAPFPRFVSETNP